MPRKTRTGRRQPSLAGAVGRDADKGVPNGGRGAPRRSVLIFAAPALFLASSATSRADDPHHQLLVKMQEGDYSRRGADTCIACHDEAGAVSDARGLPDGPRAPRRVRIALRDGGRSSCPRRVAVRGLPRSDRGTWTADPGGRSRCGSRSSTSGLGATRTRSSRTGCVSPATPTTSARTGPAARTRKRGWRAPTAIGFTRQTDPVRAKATQSGVCTDCHRHVAADTLKRSSHPMRENQLICRDCHDPSWQHRRGAVGRRHDERDLLPVPRGDARAVPVGTPAGGRRSSLFDLPCAARVQPARAAGAPRAATVPGVPLFRRAPELPAGRHAASSGSGLRVPHRAGVPELPYRSAWVEPSLRGLPAAMKRAPSLLAVVTLLAAFVAGESSAAAPFAANYDNVRSDRWRCRLCPFETASWRGGSWTGRSGFRGRRRAPFRPRQRAGRGRDTDGRPGRVRPTRRRRPYADRSGRRPGPRRTGRGRRVRRCACRGRGPLAGDSAQRGDGRAYALHGKDGTHPAGRLGRLRSTPLR